MKLETVICFLLFIFLFQCSFGQSSPVLPLTYARRIVHCHNFKENGIMSIRCSANEKIRMLDAFDVIVRNKSYLPPSCKTHNGRLMDSEDYFQRADCKIPTSYISACSGRENCTLHMQPTRLTDEKNRCYDEYVDYTIAFYECIPDTFIHDICSYQAITSAWGTLKTPNFPNPYTSNDDCWCKLSTQYQSRVVLSVIVFQLIPNDQQCVTTGLYLQGSQEQRGTQCTYLQQGHHYLSDSNTLYLNFYSRISTVRGGFWISYEANRFDADIDLLCGPRDKIGVPSNIMPVFSSSSISFSSPSWHRVTENKLSSPTTISLISSSSTRSPLEISTKRNRIMADGAFTYPYGSLSTFELAYGPQGWFLKFPYGVSNTIPTRLLQTTTTLHPIVKWNSTWVYIRKLRTRGFSTPRSRILSSLATRATISKLLTTATMTTTTTSTSSTVQLSTPEQSIQSVVETTSKMEITQQNHVISPSSLPNYRLLLKEAQQQKTLVPNEESASTLTTSEATTMLSSTLTSTTRTTTASSKKTTIPSPTPWYPPAGPFDWWHWKWQNTKFRPMSVETFISTLSSTVSTPTIRIETRTPFKLLKTKGSSTTRTITSTSTTQAQTTQDWFKWPQQEPIESTKDQLDYFEDEYSESFDTTRTKSPSRSSPSKPIEQEKLAEIDFLPTRAQWQWTGRILNGNTHLVPRYQTSRMTTVTTANELTTSNQLDLFFQRTISQTGNKKLEEVELLTQTDFTIVVVSILFIILLAIVNLILFAVRRHRHRLRGRHLLSSSFPSLFNDRTLTDGSNQGPNGGPHDSSHHLMDGATNNNNNNNDILPAVGEIVLWDEKDQGGYMIDNDGAWSKIQGSHWFGNPLAKTLSKSSFGKSFRSRFRFLRQSEKKLHNRSKTTTAGSQTNTDSLSSAFGVSTTSAIPVPINIDRSISKKQRISPASSLPKKAIEPILLSADFEQTDEYQKPMEITGEDSNYISMRGTVNGDYSLGEDEMDPGGSVIVSVPTAYRRDDDLATVSERAESIYQQQSAIPPPPPPNFVNSGPFSHDSHIPSMNRSIIVRHCQMDFQPLDAKSLFKPLKKSTCIDQEHVHQSFQLSSSDSGFIDDSMMDSLTTTSTGIFTPMDVKHSNSEQRSLKRHADAMLAGVIENYRTNNLNRNESRRVTFEDERQCDLSDSSNDYLNGKDPDKLLNCSMTKNEIRNETKIRTAKFPSKKNDEQNTDRSSKLNEIELAEERKHRQKLMNEVLESLKKKRVYFQETNDETAFDSDHSLTPSENPNTNEHRCSRHFLTSSGYLSDGLNSNFHQTTNEHRFSNGAARSATVEHRTRARDSIVPDSTVHTKQNLPLNELYTYHTLVETRF